MEDFNERDRNGCIACIIVLTFTFFLIFGIVAWQNSQEQNMQPRISPDGPGPVPYYQVTEAEKLMMAKVVKKKAANQEFEAQVAVAATILNRWVSDDPTIENDSIESVIAQKDAYGSIEDITDAQVQDCLEAVEAAVNGYDPTRIVFENGARFFYTTGGISQYEQTKRNGIDEIVIGDLTFHDDFSH